MEGVKPPTSEGPVALMQVGDAGALHQWLAAESAEGAGLWLCFKGRAGSVDACAGGLDVELRGEESIFDLRLPRMSQGTKLRLLRWGRP